MSGKFVVYKSSAGSGKTYTLVTEYLFLALNNQNPNRFKNILALTFTNKAAAEMKSRVLDFLNKLSEGPTNENNSELFDFFSERLGINKIEVSRRASSLLSYILHNYADFAISTIDRFTHRLIRSFSKDLGLTNDFGIELDQPKLLDLAVNRLMGKVGMEPQLTKILLEFSKLKVEEDKSWRIEDDVKDLGKMVFDEESILYLDYLSHFDYEDFEKVKTNIAKFINKFERQIKSCGIEALNLINSNQIKAEFMVGGKNGIHKYFSYLKDCKIKKLIPSKTVVKNVENGKWHAGKANEETIGIIDGISTELEQIYYKTQELLEKYYNDYVMATLVQPSLFTMAILNALNSILDQIKKEQNIIPISDFNKEILKIIANEPAPFIYEKLGERYKNYLIDEFQDTSILQWQNLLPLVENSLSTQELTLLVGDGKQSIYRFRNGEVEQFENLPKIFKNYKNFKEDPTETLLQNNYEERVLAHNYRSKMEIVLFNNAFFELLSKKLDKSLSSVYKTVSQIPLPKNKGGYVFIKDLIDTDEVPTDDLFFETTTKIINNCIDDGYSYSDISVLVRDNKTGSLLANELLNKNIPVISSESLLLSGNAEVKFLVGLLQFLNTPNNFGSMVSIVGFIQKRKFSNTSLHQWLKELQELINFNNQNHFAAMEQFLKKRNIFICFTNCKKTRLYQLLEDFLFAFNLSKQDNPFLQFFMEAVFNLEKSKRLSLSELMEWWELKKESLSIKTPEGIDAVNIMTIHKSKGLEFPIVIMPYANWNLRSGKKSIWVNLGQIFTPLKYGLVKMIDLLENTSAKELYQQEKNKSLLDHINLLYVGFTRAEERLYVLTGKNRTSNNTAYNLIIETVKGLENWNHEKRQFEWGHKSKNIKKTSNSSLNPIFNICYQKESIWYETAKFGSPHIVDDEEAVLYGNLIHQTLAKTIRATDLCTALESTIKKRQFAKFSQKEVFDKLKNLIENPSISQWFNSNDEVKTEVEIIDKDGKSYRLDRINENGDEVLIIDYKTGQPKDKYYTQLQGYGSLIKEMGYKKVNLALIYVDLNQVDKLNF